MRRIALPPTFTLAATGVALLVLIALLGTEGLVAAQESTGASSASANREQIWNSASMLRARAWLQDYLNHNKSITKQQAAEYEAALKSMTPAQMQLFAGLHDHAQQTSPANLTRQAHQAAALHAQQAAAAQKWWMENVHKAEAARAMAADRATEQAYADINQEESAAAGQAQRQFNAEQARARAMQQSKQDLLNNPPYWGYGYGGLYGYPGYGGLHYHFYGY